MNQLPLDKNIANLTKKLDEINLSYSLQNDDGIHYWQGMKIISENDWQKLLRENSIIDKSEESRKIVVVVSEKPFLFIPSDYVFEKPNFIVLENLKEIANKWYNTYVDFMTITKNPRFGWSKCYKCLLSGHLDDPLFVGIEKVFARIVSNHCNNDNNNDNNNDLITYHCKVMNIFRCPFDSKDKDDDNSKEEKEKSNYSYKIKDLFSLQRIAFAVEQAISTFHETTRNNQIIYEVNFKNNRVKEIHTTYNGLPESWGSNNDDDDVNDKLSKVEPISIIQIINKYDIYNILTNREKLEYLLQEYERKQLVEESTQPDVKKEQIMKGDIKQMIIDFLIDNKDSIKIEDLKISEPIYKCYREKGNCYICNTPSNIICINNHNDKEVWLCTNHWQDHAIAKHKQQLIS